MIKILFKETNINKLDYDVVTNYQIYYIMSNYLIIKGPIINIESFCSLYYYEGFNTEKFIFHVYPLLSEEREKTDDDYDYSSIEYRKFLSNNLEDTNFGFLFNQKAIIFYAEGDLNDQHHYVYALSYVKFKKVKKFKKIIPKK